MTTRAQRRKLPAGLKYATLAEVQRDSRITDAKILAGRGLDQIDIARTLKVSQPTISRWLT